MEQQTQHEHGFEYEYTKSSQESRNICEYLKWRMQTTQQLKDTKIMTINKPAVRVVFLAFFLNKTSIKKWPNSNKILCSTAWH